MQVLTSSRFVIFVIVLFAMGWNKAHGMEAVAYHSRNVNNLNIQSFLCSIKQSFFITSQHIDFIILRAVLMQYHPNEFGNITGKNLARLRRTAQKACQYFASDQLYPKMLKQICVTIDQLPIIDNDGNDLIENTNEIETCNVCGDSEREAIAISCNHVFCYECLFRWYVGHRTKDDCHHRCPCCRSLLHEQIIDNIQHDERYQKVRTKVLMAQALEEEQEQAEAQDQSADESTDDWESIGKRSK